MLKDKLPNKIFKKGKNIQGWKKTTAFSLNWKPRQEFYPGSKEFDIASILSMVQYECGHYVKYLKKYFKNNFCNLKQTQTYRKGADMLQ